MLLLQRLIITAIPRRLSSSGKYFIDRSLVPQLDEKDLEEQFVRGSGPGGQVVNKTANAVVLRHLPTNLVVKCHAHRMMDQNRKEARRLMIMKLDNFYNGEQSVESQELRVEKRRMTEATRRRKKADEMKKQWKEREKDLLDRHD